MQWNPLLDGDCNARSDLRTFHSGSFVEKARNFHWGVTVRRRRQRRPFGVDFSRGPPFRTGSSRRAISHRLGLHVFSIGPSVNGPLWMASYYSPKAEQIGVSQTSNRMIT